MSEKTYGYARVSSKEQNLDRQLDALAEFGLGEGQVFADKASASRIPLTASSTVPLTRSLISSLRVFSSSVRIGGCMAPPSIRMTCFGERNHAVRRGRAP